MLPNSVRNIVVAIESQADAAYVFKKVRALLAAVDSDRPAVHVVRVVHEAIADLNTRYVERSPELKSLILQGAQTELVDILDDCAGGIDRLESMALWNANTWEGILHFAEANSADLIVKASHWEGSTRGIGRTPDDWNLLRHATVPVLLVKDSAWPATPKLVAAVDAFDENHGGLGVDILSWAGALREALKGVDLDIVSVYPHMQPWIGELGAGAGNVGLRDGIVKEVEAEIVRFARAAEVDAYHLRVEEGPTVRAIGGVVESDRANLLVIGTHARDGVRGVLLGNTAEKLLFEIDVDVLVVRGAGQAD